ncbi:pyridoxamine 5'-phosphate oxidase family protein [Actinomycetospora aeridis]|uniref:Pyridoxamine 5'-phosphate oxidase family protein n=1 Tax=Actinomycetospora aeridis TaxID=3129231 RepID=A0ABU8N3G1_9PSEU
MSDRVTPQPDQPDPHPDGPGSAGERALQDALGTSARAARFYDDQMCDRLVPSMQDFLGRMSMAFVATSDAHGECDSTFRAGPPGFVRVLDDRHVAWPEYRGNGVMASLGNISENPHVGLMMIDFTDELIGLHVNGSARIVEDDALRAEHPDLPEEAVPGRRADLWVEVTVEEAYIHCRKHIPRMVPVDRTQSWGTDDVKRKGGDHFGVAGARRAEARERADTAVGDPRTAEHAGAGASSGE